MKKIIIGMLIIFISVFMLTACTSKTEQISEEEIIKNAQEQFGYDKEITVIEADEIGS